MSEQAGEAVPAAQRSSWTSFLKSIASVSGDLSSMTAPPFILSPVSLTEFPAYWCERPELFSAIADATNDEDRAIAVLKWFISTLKGQYTSRNESMGSEKKPLNPVLGELFYGYWPDKNGRGQTDLLVEQVSHHPPITAYVIENESRGVKLVGHNAQKTSFSSGSIIVKQIGHAILTVKLPSGDVAEYLLTLPRLRIDGLWYGSPYIELTETSYIISNSYVCSIEYKGKGYFSGKSHSFKAIMSPAPGFGGAGAKEHVVEGLWHQTSKYISGPRSGKDFHDVNGPKEEVTAIGAEKDGKMGEFETRQLWKLVAKGIREGDFEMASREKSKIENEQRQRRRDEVAAGTTWRLKHFKHIDNDPTYERLGKLVKITPPTEDAYVFQENWPSAA
ncbi:oxysterol binding protein [Moniliophthora roreri MCA 2997]|uniref:Oxysterol binding protein n=1 Tax=Moniliophthora roreri (strain MCA 2997) TaxID=1381753 RepID=V2XD52_MONRO|nr:oxysterol binding protein [Moniliophthora roreri MCA 2997]